MRRVSKKIVLPVSTTAVTLFGENISNYVFIAYFDLLLFSPASQLYGISSPTVQFTVHLRIHMMENCRMRISGLKITSGDGARLVN